jgi:hypothetical protein
MVAPPFKWSELRDKMASFKEITVLGGMTACQSAIGDIKQITILKTTYS